MTNFPIFDPSRPPDSPLRQEELISWYRLEKRDLPWRKSKDPYHIWISETMLQQTTTETVTPYFQKFISRFSNVQQLANAKLEEVLELWAGLGYYSRARNLHRAAQEIATLEEFPSTYQALLQYSGFGPYTARAVASIAFDQSVGVLDGNVIRVLCRYLGATVNWWQQGERAQLQAFVDHWVQGYSSSEMNQALMELGKMICRPSSPFCWKCPIKASCIALKQNLVDKLPMKKAKKPFELWHWKVELTVDENEVALIKNKQAPFLRNQWVFTGEFEKLISAPPAFDFRHTITHHQIYVTISQVTSKLKSISKSEVKWCSVFKIKQINPSSLLEKVLKSKLVS